ncbi:hypothetical protein F0231_04805 [Vibrio sp. RE86]|uniref:hypothetical protein n=1 Tax=Vibrio sp. RE86 TaxID=2607605 RepID=UPI0014939D1A|nr:hypothetical protein [Vibrio sp. RE86]NOH79060.1 hypothetical protein [Vibrio sp. RE86]
MKKSLIALIVAGSFALAGCSSSGGTDVNDRDIDPEWGVVPPPVQPPVDNTPDRPQPEVDPDFGVDTTPDWGLEPVDPDFGITPDDTPDRLPPTWGGACGSPDDGANCDPIPPKPPADVDNDWGISTDPEVSPSINSIDRNKVRDAVRSRLNG